MQNFVLSFLVLLNHNKLEHDELMVLKEGLDKLELDEDKLLFIDEAKAMIDKGVDTPEKVIELRETIGKIRWISFTPDESKAMEILYQQLYNKLLEEKIDKDIKKYNGFSGKNPMDGVNYDEINKTYSFRHGKQASQNKNKNLVCEQALLYLKDKFPHGAGKFVFFKIRQNFEYHNKNFVIYMDSNDAYFDIRHVIQVLELSEKNKIDEKYKEYSTQIIGYCPIMNKFGGYFIREFITEETMFNIILSSNSALSKAFKKNVSKILVQLRQEGLLLLTNNNMSIEVAPSSQLANPSTQLVKKKRIIKDIAGCLPEIVNEAFSTAVMKISCVYLFTVGLVANIRDGMNIPVDYPDESYLIKYGMTEDLERRMGEHEKTYNAIEGSNLRLKYQSWINEEYISKAEVEIKEKLKLMKIDFKYGDMVELAIVTPIQLKELGIFYEKLFASYGGSLKSIIAKYETELMKERHEKELLISRHETELQKKEVELQKKETELLKKELELYKQSAEKDKEIQDLKKNQKRSLFGRKT